jgi:hypothetical protein
MSSLMKVLKLFGVLVSIFLGALIGLVKLFGILFADEDTETQISSPGMLVGDTSLGTAESVTINDDGVEVGSMSGQPVIRHL